MEEQLLDQINITKMTDSEVEDFMKNNGINIKVSEVRKVAEMLGRDPTLTECHIFNTEWSEHCSYKSSRDVLKLLPTAGSTVIMGPKEDAGIIFLKEKDGERYGIAISHESHNHPSQVVPYEGAATGIGGNVRDVLCMGARVIACADPLRFGDPFGKHANRTKYIAGAVIDGIAGYGNPIGVPVIAGDVYMNSSFDDNCLVNVVTMGLIKEREVVHSACPENAEGYDVICVGKATDNSGFGGAAFASVILDEKDEESNKGAVQVPDPFLKNVLIRATEAVFKEVREKDIDVGFKDCGAGGYMCATSELGAAGGQGVEWDIEKVHTSMDIPPYITACSETQERFVWIVPEDFTPTVLKIYNEDFELPNVAEKAKAAVVGKVRGDKRYIVRYKGKIVCDSDVDTVTTGIKYQREAEENKRDVSEPDLSEPDSYNAALLSVLDMPQIANKSLAYEHYDTEVQGLTVIRPGEADAGVMAPIPGDKVGVALSADSNPRYSRINPKLGAANAVAEAMRNVAAVGAVPYGMTDCLCFGNPEVPTQFWDFKEGVNGLVEAATNLHVKGTQDPCPFVSGNVSFYNESAEGKSIDPSAIVACVGVLEDYSKAITTKFKKPGTGIYLVGPRKDELGGSAYYESRGELGANVPVVDYEQERGMIYGVIDAISLRLLLACHDVSDGGLITAVSEMVIGKDGKKMVGANLQMFGDMRADKSLFSESSGFVMEIDEDKVSEVEKIFAKYGIDMFRIGETTEQNLVVSYNDVELINIPCEDIAEAWLKGFEEAMR